MARIIHKIPNVDQGRSPVCWLACAMMVFQFKRRRTLNIEELDFGNGDFRNSTISNLTTMPLINARLRRYGFRVRRINQVHVNLRATYSDPGRNPEETRFVVRQSNAVRIEHNVIHALLVNHGPFILFHRCGTIPYRPNQVLSASGSHAILITGVDLDQKVCWFNNPWGDVNNVPVNTNIPVSLELIVGAIRNWETSGYPSVAYMV